MTERKRLSLCMITWNDENYLSNCLQNINQIVDEIIIVDLGSIDKTVNIAIQAGANVYKMKWKNNYSEAKNLCLDQAKGRWILFLQPNETISAEQLREIGPLLDNPNVEGYLLYIDQSLENYNISSPVQSLRLFRNRKEYRYKYKAFEYIPDELLTNIKDTGIRIFRRADSNLSYDIHSLFLLQEELNENPESSYLQYMYGIELLNQKKYEESIIYFQKARRNVNLDYLFAPHLYKCLGWSYIFLQQYSDALEVLDEGVKFFSYYTDLLVLRGELRKQYQQYGEAIQDLESSLKIREQPNYKVPGPEINTSIILETLGEIHEQLFNYRQALACYQQAQELNKTNHELLYKIGELVKKANSTGVLENLMKAAIEQNDLEQMMILMDILSQQREYLKVLTYVEDLETFFGKGEQTESIKFSCCMMLGENEKAELHFSAIGKGSPFYNQILLQRIENYWVHNQWQEAGRLLEEMDQIESVENLTKVLYHSLHKLFIEKELCCFQLEQQEYEIVNTVLEKFLWLDQVDKAQLLLPLLLHGAKDDDQYIKLAQLWAERNDFNVIQRIFQRISNKEKQVEFKQKIAEQLQRNEHIEAAKELAKLGDPLPLGVLEYVLWSKGFIKKLKKYIGEIQQKNSGANETEVSKLQMAAIPGKALLTFYHSLGLSPNTMNDSTLKHDAEEMSIAKIHREIGSYYEKVNKKREALFAYLRTLQWDPLDDLSQNKVRDIFDENPDKFNDFLEEISWTLEGEWFHNDEEFINYILGFINFKKQHFSKAIESFSKIAEYETSYPVALAYIISSFWIEGKEAEAEKWLDEQSRISEVLSLFFCICKSYTLARLEEGHRQYPYSEIIMLEKQRIC